MTERPNREVAILNAALELTAAERPAYLGRACAGDAALRQRVEELLWAHERAEDFLESPPADLKLNRTVLHGNSVVGQPGESFGDYELLTEIARGGMGVVYKARQKSLDRQVAVKMLLFGPRASPALIRRFKVEAVAAGSLHHPNIVAIHEVGVYDGQQFIVMDYVDGPNLGILARDQPLQAKRAAAYVRTIATAIHHAHEHGILHRDLKPSNVIVGADDQPRVTDFGLARRLDGESSLTLTGQVLGSPNFIPPEQAASHHGKVSRRSDVYGLGGILYYLLTGRPPFQGEDIARTLDQVMTSDVVPPRLLNSEVPSGLEMVCLKCLEKDSAKRYATAQEVAQDLERFLNDEPVLAQPLPWTNFSQSLWANSEYLHGWLDTADKIIPDRRYLFHVVCSFLRHFARGEHLRICDLGCGDGALTQQILNVFPGASLTLLDGAPAMLDAARRRLGDRPQLLFVQAAFDSIIDERVTLGPFDGIVSGFAIHHLAQSERVGLFFKLKEQLVPGGWFLNLDTVFPDESVFTDWQYELWREWILETEKHRPRPDSLRDIPDENRRNPDKKLSRLASQLNALRRAGFETVDCLYRNGIFVVYCGRRPLAESDSANAPQAAAENRVGIESRKKLRIGLIGDYRPEVTAHRAVVRSLQLAGDDLEEMLDAEWLPTNVLKEFPPSRFFGFDGFWCVPASPYVSMDGALRAIRFAREHGVPFLGTCAGFQHALIEYARNVLGLTDADHEETRPDAACALISRLPSPMVETEGRVLLEEGSRLRQIYERDSSTEVYHCNFGLSPVHEARLASGRLLVCARDPARRVHAVELPEHPFFVATLFQPERSALRDEVNPLIRAFVQASKDHRGD